MNQFPAALKGVYIPENPWKGSVLSVYKKAVNILHPDGFLVSLLKDREQMSGYGLVVPGLFTGTYPDRLKGKSVLYRSGTLTVDPFCSVNFAGSASWSGIVPVCNKTLPLKHLLSTYREQAPLDGFSSLILGNSADIYGRAALSILKKAGTGRTLDLYPLVGLGIGFTPSGDDFISGVLLFVTMFGKSERYADFSVKRTAITGVLDKTTPGGRTLLSLVLKNSFPEYLRVFASVLCSAGKPKEIESAVSLVLTHGSTSGSDALAGFLWFAELN